MCLAVPGLVESIFESNGLRMAKVNFGGIRKSACLQLTPDASVGEYVLVHVGFAMSVINEDEAQRTLRMLRFDNELGELEPNSFEQEP